MIFIARDFEIQSGFNKYIWIQILPILSYLLKYILWGSKTKAHDQGPGTPFH